MEKHGKNHKGGNQLRKEKVTAFAPTDALKRMTRKTLLVIGCIHEKYPELAVFISEMNDSYAETQTGEPTVHILERYCDSLMEIVRNYKRTHPDLGNG